MSKYQQARELIKRIPDRSDFIAAAQEQLKISRPAAATYFQNIVENERFSLSELRECGWQPPQ